MLENRIDNLFDTGRVRGIALVDIKQAIALEKKDQVMLSLRKLGFSFQEIGDYYGKSRQWAEQLLPGGDHAVRLECIDPDKIAESIWGEAINDMDWWGSTGRLIHSRLVQRFRDNHYSWKDARSNARQYSISKLKVILFAKFGVNITDDNDITRWFSGFITVYTKAEIFAILNRNQPIQVTVRSFNREWMRLGLKSPKKDKVRFEYQFLANPNE